MGTKHSSKLAQPVRESSNENLPQAMAEIVQQPVALLQEGTVHDRYSEIWIVEVVQKN